MQASVSAVENRQQNNSNTGGNFRGFKAKLKFQSQVANISEEKCDDPTSTLEQLIVFFY